MRSVGIRESGGPVTLLDLPDPRPLRDSELLLELQAAGVGNWDEFVRTSGWVNHPGGLRLGRGPGVAADHEDDPGPVDVGLVMGGQPFVVSDGAPVPASGLLACSAAVDRTAQKYRNRPGSARIWMHV